MLTFCLSAALFFSACSSRTAPVEPSDSPSQPVEPSDSLPAPSAASFVPFPITQSGVASDGGAFDTLSVTFEVVYPLFLTRKLAPPAKANQWRAYHGRWVRWSGVIAGFTKNGIAIRMRPDTTTFDVSVALDARGRERVRRHRVGEYVTYAGRLNSFDDVFRTLYLVQGDVAPPADAAAGAATVEQASLAPVAFPTPATAPLPRSPQAPKPAVPTTAGALSPTPAPPRPR